MNMIRRDAASLKGWANVWSQEKRLRPNSENIAMLKDHMMKSTLTVLRLTREWVQQRSSTAISRMVRRLAASWPKRLPNNSTIFAAEATAITLALNYYRHMDFVQHDVIIYSDSMSCLQAIEGEDTDNPRICQITNLLWALSDLCPLLLGAKPLWHWGEWDSGPTSKGNPWPWDRPTNNCPLCRFEATGQLLHSAGGPN